MFQLNQGNGVYSCTIEVSVFLGSQTVDLSYLLWPTHDHLLISFYLFFCLPFSVTAVCILSVSIPAIPCFTAVRKEKGASRG